MPGICGWVGRSSAEGEWSPRLLAGMLRDCGAQSGIETPGLRETWLHFGCLGASAPNGARLHADDAFAVALSDPLRRASGRWVAARDLADLYRVHGLDFLRRLRGPLALALYDRAQQFLVLAVDRSGQRSLYFYRDGERLIFASRLRALRRLPGFRAEIDPQALFDYCAFQAVPGPGTIYRHCLKLLPAQLLVIRRDGTYLEHAYWHPPYREDSFREPAALVEEFRALLPPAVERARDGQTPALFLAPPEPGGRVLLEALSVPSDRPVAMYFPACENAGSASADPALSQAKRLGGEPRPGWLSPQTLAEILPEIAAEVDEPLGDPLLIPAFLCAREARAAGFERLLTTAGARLLERANWAGGAGATRWPEAVCQRLLGPVVRRLPEENRLAPADRLRRVLLRAEMPPPERWLFDHGWQDWERLFAPEFLASIDPSAPQARTAELYNRAKTVSEFQRMRHLYLKIDLADTRLRLFDQAGRLAGITLFHPLLDEEILAFAAALPPDPRFWRFRSRSFLNQVLAASPSRAAGGRKSLLPRANGRPGCLRAPPAGLLAVSLEPLEARQILHPACRDWLAGPGREGMGWTLTLLSHWLESHGD